MTPSASMTSHFSPSTYLVLASPGRNPSALTDRGYRRNAERGVYTRPCPAAEVLAELAALDALGVGTRRVATVIPPSEVRNG